MIFRSATCLTGWSKALAALGVAALLWAPANARATPAQSNIVNYVFSPGTTVTLDATDTITGSFSYNTVTDLASNINIVLTGASVYSGQYDYEFSQWNSDNTLGFATAGDNNGNGYLLYMGFRGALGSDNLPQGDMVAYNGPTGNKYSSASTGGVTFAPAAAVPEPASLAVLGAGLAMLSLKRRRRA